MSDHNFFLIFDSSPESIKTFFLSLEKVWFRHFSNSVLIYMICIFVVFNTRRNMIFDVCLTHKDYFWGNHFDSGLSDQGFLNQDQVLTN